MNFSQQDVLDALYAQRTREMAQTEQATPEDIVRSHAYSRQDAREQLAVYARGAALLDAGYQVATSARNIIDGEPFSAAVATRIVSPVVVIESGHVATAQAYRRAALVAQ